jgi:iron complex transport system permease protein
VLLFKKTQKLTLFSLFKLLIFFLLIFLLTLTISLSFGGIHISFIDFLQMENRTLLYDIRLPRLLADFMVGASLSIVGMSFQTFFRNPLADPYILGLSGAAAVGVVLSLLLGLEFIVYRQLLSFILAICTIFIIYKLSGGINKITINALILIGVGLNFFFASVITLFSSVMSDRFTKNILMWYMGDTALINPYTVVIVLLIIILFSFILYLESPKLNIYLLGDEITINSGIDIRRFSIKIYILGSVITALAVSLCGAIGFIGIIVPHIVKIIFGMDHRVNMLSTFFLGGIFVMVVDTIFKTLFYPYEIPLGAITAIIGTPVFIYLVRYKL